MRRCPSCGRVRISRPLSNGQALIDRFRQARSDPAQVVLEGFHPLKHALRFGADVQETAALDAGELARLTQALAPDLAGVLDQDLTLVPPALFRQLCPVPPPTGVIALAPRPAVNRSAMLHNPGPAPLVLLENPRSHGNAGAAIRAAAAAGAAGVLATGEHDPWHPSALVGSAGLHFALPVAGWPDFAPAGTDFAPDETDREPWGKRMLLAFDPAGAPLRPGGIPDRALLIFGSEREGVSPGLLAMADDRIALPMLPGVSSLNLATAVAVALYTWRLGQESPSS